MPGESNIYNIFLILSPFALSTFVNKGSEKKVVSLRAVALEAK